MQLLRALLRNVRGGTAIEYAFVASLIAVAALAGFRSLGGAVDNSFTNVNDVMTNVNN